MNSVLLDFFPQLGNPNVVEGLLNDLVTTDFCDYY